MASAVRLPEGGIYRIRTWCLFLRGLGDQRGNACEKTNGDSPRRQALQARPRCNIQDVQYFCVESMTAPSILHAAISSYRQLHEVHVCLSCRVLS